MTELQVLNDFYAEIKKFGVKKASELSHVPAITIYSWMCGINSPSFIYAQKVANAIGMEFLIFDME
jgi:hypothetical protein